MSEVDLVLVTDENRSLQQEKGFRISLWVKLESIFYTRIGFVKSLASIINGFLQMASMVMVSLV